MTFAYVIPHGAEVTLSVMTGRVTIRHPKFPTVRLRPRCASSFWWLSPITTKGQRLELRR